MVRAVEEEIRTLDRAIPVYGVRTLEDSISGAYLGQRIGSWMLGLFGGLALLLAAVGLYGVLAHAVALRTREFGIRLALGATRWDMLRLVLAHGLQLTGLGLAIGLGLSVGVTRFLQKLLFGVSPTDAVTLVGVALVLSGVALVACYLPARRAMRIDPIVAMRYE
jgi:ABC-type antimicrobial peptide transport system permease subunit